MHLFCPSTSLTTSYAALLWLFQMLNDEPGDEECDATAAEEWHIAGYIILIATADSLYPLIDHPDLR